MSISRTRYSIRAILFDMQVHTVAFLKSLNIAKEKIFGWAQFLSLFRVRYT